MILGFKLHWPPCIPKLGGSETKFIHKIAKSIPMGYWWDWEGRGYIEDFFSLRPIPDSCRPKIHSIREDRHKRWKSGTTVHFYVNTRKPNMMEVAPPVPCISVQEFEICNDELGCEVACCEPYFRVDGRILGLAEMEKLAENDGFPDVYSFLKWFPERYKGRIIHWTHFKY
ncbi:hypothetical protein ACOKFD_15770 [Flagellimonas sp. S174]|uniref:hypothetical protein n=1 Tax=Flagellimonas sp. S174 TaxID=3410790 RepID=UPI003BF4D61E